MKDELFADLLDSAEEMVAIESGQQQPGRQHHYQTPDVKAIREASGKSRAEFAEIIGASYESVKSWENQRRNPTGATRKLLTLIEHNPKAMIELLKASG